MRPFIRGWVSARRMGRPFGGRGFSLMGLVFVLVLLGIFFAAWRMMDRSSRREAAALQEAMMDPRSSVETFFRKCRGEMSFKEGDWKELLYFMSEDDLKWMEENLRIIASKNPRMEGNIAMAVTDAEKRYGALEVLLPLGARAQEKVVARVETEGSHGVAFVHPAGSTARMQEVFLIQEDGLWKIRRFLNNRDSYSFMHPIIEEKRWQDVPLTEDERMYQEDPKRYARNQRRHFLQQAGVSVEALEDADEQVESGP